MFDALIGFFSNLGPECLLMAMLISGFFGWGFIRKWWYIGPMYEAMKDDRDFHRARGEVGTVLATVATNALEATDA